jgi:hypothetical protein
MLITIITHSSPSLIVDRFLAFNDSSLAANSTLPSLFREISKTWGGVVVIVEIFCVEVELLSKSVDSVVVSLVDRVEGSVVMGF